VGEIILVVRSGEEIRFAELAEASGYRKSWRCVSGGAERQDSVWNGLQALSADAAWVAIHDGARPCTSPATVRATFEAARRVGAAVAAHKVRDTIKEADDQGRVLRTVDRERLWSVQTPQVFRVDILRRALEVVRDRGLEVTDDAAACECIGQPVELVESEDPNPKVTVRADLEYVELLLRNRGS
jgi:2-C-methyl-D-erythritol 4-phosphate cytidylyltransferase